MKKTILVFLVTFTVLVSCRAEHTLSELCGYVEEEFSKSFEQQDYSHLVKYCVSAAGEWSNASMEAYRNSIAQVTRPLKTKSDTNNLAQHGRDYCDQQYGKWQERQVNIKIVEESLTLSKELKEFLIKFTKENDQEMQEKALLAITIIEKQFTDLSRSFIKYLRGEMSNEIKSQSLVSGYLWAWGSSLSRKANRWYNNEGIFDNSLPFETQKIIHDTFISSIFGERYNGRIERGFIKTGAGLDKSNRNLYPHFYSLVPLILESILKGQERSQ